MGRGAEAMVAAGEAVGGKCNCLHMSTGLHRWVGGEENRRERRQIQSAIPATGACMAVVKRMHSSPTQAGS